MKKAFFPMLGWISLALLLWTAAASDAGSLHRQTAHAKQALRSELPQRRSGGLPPRAVSAAAPGTPPRAGLPSRSHTATRRADTFLAKL